MFSYINVCQVPRKMEVFNTQDDRSDAYRGTLGHSSVHG